MSEPFKLKKLLDFSPFAFYKLAGLLIKLGFVILIIFGLLWVKNLLFPAASTVKDINVHEGGKVIINENKRRLEYFVGAQGSTDKEGDARIGLFGGIKW